MSSICVTFVYLWWSIATIDHNWLVFVYNNLKVLSSVSGSFLTFLTFHGRNVQKLLCICNLAKKCIKMFLVKQSKWLKKTDKNVFDCRKIDKNVND